MCAGLQWDWELMSTAGQPEHGSQPSDGVLQSWQKVMILLKVLTERAMILKQYF